MKQERTKPTYNLWQCTAFMLKNAWHTRKSAIIGCILIAVLGTGKSVAEMLVAPMILRQVESAASLSALLGTIGLFTAILVLCSGIKDYLAVGAMFPRMDVRIEIIRQLNVKSGNTSYPNRLNTRFLETEEKSYDACSSNSSPTENIWKVWALVLTNVFGFCVYLFFVSDLNPLLLVIVILTTIVGWLVNRRVQQWGYDHREEQAAYIHRSRYFYKVSTDRAYAKDIRIFGLKSWLDELWNKTLALYRGFLYRREKIYCLSVLADLILSFLRNGAAYGFLIALTLRDGLPASQFLLYFAAISGFTEWITGILEQSSDLYKECLEISQVMEYLNWPEPFRFAGGVPVPTQPDGDYEICLSHVSYRYPESDKEIIHDMSLTLHPGEKVAVVGLNGAGKTTLVRLICGFLDPTEGTVTLNGMDIRSFNRPEYYDLFSAVFQDFSLMEASLAVNVAQTVNGIDEEKVQKCLSLAGLTEKVRSLPKGTGTPIGRMVYEDGVELSGGETQRLMLARALYKDGAILLLDEPTAALDPIAENDIYLKYNEMSQGKTSVFISHRLASTRFCDRILYMEDGVIAEEGTHEELLAKGGGYAKLFDIQSRYYQEGGAA
ncbi:MAG: ABC transporter ATP-binding protein/permease [Clostridiales bacterium]|nr:ABC transporter ATP-binding protein/permease [Clostridiales bacterium]